jgi:hypothetical protein
VKIFPFLKRVTRDFFVSSSAKNNNRKYATLSDGANLGQFAASKSGPIFMSANVFLSYQCSPFQWHPSLLKKCFFQQCTQTPEKQHDLLIV